MFMLYMMQMLGILLLPQGLSQMMQCTDLFVLKQERLVRTAARKKMLSLVEGHINNHIPAHLHRSLLPTQPQNSASECQTL